MLKNAKVLISLEDLDELRLKERHYDQLLREISNCVEFDFEDYSKELMKIDKDDTIETDEQLDEAEAKARSYARIKVCTEKLDKIILNNCDLNKTENEVALFEALADSKIIYSGVYKDKAQDR